MEKVLAQAELLAEAILSSEEYIRMRLAEQAAIADTSATELVSAYQERRAEVETILSANDLDHGELAKAGEALEAAEKALDDCAIIKDMRDSRADFSDMMNQVNALIKLVVTGEAPEEEAGGCSGSCSSCGGGCGGH